MIRSLFEKFQKDRRLGVNRNKRQYDLPLNKSAGTNFLVLLVALMTFLIIMAVAGSLGVHSLTQSWTSGLENKATIEIPAEKSDGSLRNKAQIQNFTTEVAEALKNNKNVLDFTIMSEKDISDLVSPWLGNDMLLNEIPLPQLISVELNNSKPEVIDDLIQDLALINDNIRLDTHENWLIQLLRITNSLQFAGAFIVIIIAATTITAIAGGVRSRMAIYRADIELLHLMGASDEYITKQFQRHALIISAKGSLIGTLMAVIALLVIHTLKISGLSSLSSGADGQWGNIAIVILTPVIACLVSLATARMTVLRELSQMP